MIRLLLFLLGRVSTGKTGRPGRARSRADARSVAAHPGSPVPGARNAGMPDTGPPYGNPAHAGPPYASGPPTGPPPPGAYHVSAHYAGPAQAGPAYASPAYAGAAPPDAGLPYPGGTMPFPPPGGVPVPPPGAVPGGPVLPGRVRGGPGGGPGGRPRRWDTRGTGRVPRWVKWASGLALVTLIFRRAVASIVLLALSAALHVLGFNIHLPHIRFAWPWQTITSGTTTNTNLGPWVLQKIEGISRPALGQANFNFVFTHKVSKSIGPWPCWYASTFYAVGHASATVNLNPGPAWWAPATGHYRLKVLSRPHGGKPGRVAVTMTLPQPQLPTSAHGVTIDNLPSKPIDTQHSWTYPGLGCGVLVKPQFEQSVLYAQAQTIAFYKATHSPQIVRPLIGTAEAQATQTIRNNFIQPTLNAFGYTLTGFTVDWTTHSAPAPPGTAPSAAPASGGTP